jgi:uncharacterized protein (UPF0332 family)
MASIKWCCNQKEGIRLIDPSDNLALGYMKMAEDSIGTMNRERNYNLTFAVSACYYSMYYSVYAIMMKVGVKCEIHTCTLEFMRKFLNKFYSPEEIKLIEKAFECRGTVQYYVDRILRKEDSDFIMAKAPFFLSKSKEILSKINQKDIEEIRKNLSPFLKK